jgi:hypothetical protein
MTAIMRILCNFNHYPTDRYKGPFHVFVHVSSPMEKNPQI